MKKRTVIFINGVLLFWFFLDMIGLRIGDRLIVSRAFREDGVFFIIYLVLFVLFVYRERSGRFMLSAWLFLWFASQFFSHWYVTIFGPADEKIGYFSDTVKIISSSEIYIPDLYHSVLHLLIVAAFITVVAYQRLHLGPGNKKRH